MKLSRERANTIHEALDKITECSDALYTLLNIDSDARLSMRAKGFHPTHDLNSAVGLIRGQLSLAGYKQPEKKR